MHDLETKTQKILPALIHGDRHIFTDGDRQTLALWAAKTAITYRASQAKYPDTDKRILTIPRQWLDLFYRAIPKPPPCLTVNLALNGAAERFHFLPHPFKLQGKHIIGELDVDRITLVFDHLVMQVVTAYDFQGFYSASPLIAEAGRAVHRIWPDTSPIMGAVSFPPPMAMSGEDVWTLAHGNVNTAAL